MTELKVLNPSTEEVVETLDYTSEADINAQIDRAEQAFQSWRKVDAHERSRLLWAWSALIKQHKDELARLITLEGGKPFKEAQGEVDYAVSYVDWYAEEAKRTYGRTIPANTPEKKLLLINFRLGSSVRLRLGISQRR